ncbi:hypothetical protein HpM116_10660 [Helicobacter pylori]
MEKVFPLSCVRSPGTFSSKNLLGFLANKKRMISKNKVPLVSSSPRRFPALEKGWQGKPANNTSKLGISFVLICVISPCGVSLK